MYYKESNLGWVRTQWWDDSEAKTRRAEGRKERASLYTGARGWNRWCSSVHPGPVTLWGTVLPDQSRTSVYEVPSYELYHLILVTTHPIERADPGVPIWLVGKWWEEQLSTARRQSLSLCLWSSQNLPALIDSPCVLSHSVVSDSLWPPWTVDSSVHEILQARILEWVAIPFFGGSSRPRDRTPVSCICRRILYRLRHQGSPWLTGDACKIAGELATATQPQPQCIRQSVFVVHMSGTS